MDEITEWLMSLECVLFFGFVTHRWKETLDYIVELKHIKTHNTMYQAQLLLFLSQHVELDYVYDITREQFYKIPTTNDFPEFTFLGSRDAIEHRFLTHTHYYRVEQEAGLDSERVGYYAAHLVGDPPEYMDLLTEEISAIVRNQNLRGLSSEAKDMDMIPMDEEASKLL